MPKSVQQGPALAPAGFSGLRGRSGQTCNFWSSHPAAYFFLCQLLAAGRPDHSGMRGQDWPALCVKCPTQEKTTECRRQVYCVCGASTATCSGGGRSRQVGGLFSFFFFRNVQHTISLHSLPHQQLPLLQDELDDGLPLRVHLLRGGGEEQKNTTRSTDVQYVSYDPFLFPGTHPTRPLPAGMNRPIFSQYPCPPSPPPPPLFIKK